MLNRLCFWLFTGSVTKGIVVRFLIYASIGGILGYCVGHFFVEPSLLRMPK